MELDDNDDENFDTNTPDPKSKLHDKKDKSDKDDFEDNSDDTELEDLEVEIEDEKPAPKEEKTDKRDNKFQARSEEHRLGKRRNKFKQTESRLIRDMEAKFNAERARNDRLENDIKEIKASTNRMSDSNVDSQINEATRYLNQAKAAHAQAVKDGDGDAAAEALDVMMEAKETLTVLNGSKQRRDMGGGEVKAVKQAPQVPTADPAVIRKFSRWQADNDWYDPALRDKFSRITFHIDNAMCAEGYDPRTDEYWEELDYRLHQNPTLQAEVFNEDDQEEEEMEEEQPKRREVNGRRETGSSSRQRPAPQNDRSSANTGNRKKVVVSRERADAMRQMGLQPGTSEWKRMAKKYENYDKQRKGAN